MFDKRAVFDYKRDLKSIPSLRCSHLTKNLTLQIELIELANKKSNIMKNAVIFILSLILLIPITQAQDNTTQDLIDSYVNTLPENAEVAIGFIKDGSMMSQGYRKKNGSIISVENNLSSFEIGSITKTYTATLLMNQVQNGSLSLDDPICKYFNDSEDINNPAFDEVTFRHILTHTSGLEPSPSTIIFPYLKGKIFNKCNPYKFITWKHYRKYLQKQSLAHKPGQKWVYNNAAFGVLAELLAQKEGSTWESQIQKQIFDNLGMQHSYPTGKNVPEENFVQGHNAEGEPAPYWELGFMNPSGSIKSCVKDQLLFLNAHLTAAEHSVFQKMKTVYDIEAEWKGSVIGNAWGHRITDESHIIWHGGSTGAFRSFCSYDDEAKTAVVILVNFNNSHPNMKRDGKSLIRTYGYKIQNALKGNENVSLLNR